MVDLHSSREAGSAQGPPSATERRECKSRVTLLLRDADSGQIDHMAAEPTHGPHHPCTSSSRLGARGTLLAIANVSLNGGSRCLLPGLCCMLSLISQVAAPNRRARGCCGGPDGGGPGAAMWVLCGVGSHGIRARFPHKLGPLPP